MIGLDHSFQRVVREVDNHLEISKFFRRVVAQVKIGD
jgi:hypothetical protein